MVIIMALFASRDERVIKKLMKQVELINEIEKEYINLSKDELQDKTAEFKERIKMVRPWMMYCARHLQL